MTFFGSEIESGFEEPRGTTLQEIPGVLTHPWTFLRVCSTKGDLLTIRSGARQIPGKKKNVCAQAITLVTRLNIFGLFENMVHLAININI